MSLLTVAVLLERMANQRAATPVAINQARCLLSCTLCTQMCPMDAITLPDHQPTVDLERCTACGLCLHGCPTGVFEGRDRTMMVLKRVEELRPTAMALACEAHPQPATPDVITLQAKGCLGECGVSLYVSLAALGVQTVLLRLDACQHCPLGTTQASIEAIAQTANAVLQQDLTHPMLDAVSGNVQEVYQADNALVSRRQMFSTLADRGARLYQELFPTQDVQIQGEKSPPRERRRLLRSLCHLDSHSTPDKPLQGVAFGQWTVDDTCIACGVCEKICPTGAMRFWCDDERYQVQFTTAACIACGRCAEVCQPHALHSAAPASYTEVVCFQPVVLSEGPLRHCARCKAPFAGDGDLCPVCAFRRQNPFGSRK